MSLVDEAAPELERLGAANRAFAHAYPGERAARQPVHTVYGGAQLFTADIARRMGELALKCMKDYGRDPVEFARGVGFASSARDPDARLAAAVHARVLAKLEREPVEDYRIDFE